ncbi:MAG: YvcK family protein [bacterium]|nr:YvcK family protein [bacterium]
MCEMKPQITKDKKFVVIGGGTGIFSVLTGLSARFNDVTAVVTMADDGGSAGVLREEFGMLPPGDVRRAIVALGRTDNKVLSELFNYRFEEGAGLVGHSFGNLLLTALERITGSFPDAISAASEILAVRGRVLPVTLASTRLYAELEDGHIVKGETNIDIPKHDGRLRIKRVWLSPKASLNPDVRRAIRDADAVVIGPGDLYTSIIPNVVVGGMREALARTKAKKIYITNIVTKFGETNHFAASEFVRMLELYTGKGVLDYVIANKRRPTLTRMKPYLAEGANLVELDAENFNADPTLIAADVIRAKGLVRHDPKKIASTIARLV